MVPFAFLAMAVFRLPLAFNKKISFYKLLGCGRNGTFDKIPDLQQWGILAAHKEIPANHVQENNHVLLLKLYGSFIAGWARIFKCETFSILLEPIEGHGYWDSKEVFGKLPKNSTYNGPVAILTRASIRLSKLRRFWKHVPSVASKFNDAPGFVMSVGIGELPWIRQATFSIWENKTAMTAAAYGLKEHTNIIKKTTDEQWYKESMFIRFSIIAYTGTIKGVDPLKGKQ
jgi:hypothetical protein